MFFFRSHPPTAPPLSHLLPNPHQNAEWTLRCARACEQLVELGMRLVESAAAAAAQAFLTGTMAQQKTHTLIFTRLSYAVRQAIALETRLRLGQTLHQAPAAPQAPAPPPIPSAAPPGPDQYERLDASFAHVTDEEIPSLLEGLAKDLGIEIPQIHKTQSHPVLFPKPHPQPHQSNPPPATGPPLSR